MLVRLTSFYSAAQGPALTFASEQPSPSLVYSLLSLRPVLLDSMPRATVRTNVVFLVPRTSLTRSSSYSCRMVPYSRLRARGEQFYLKDQVGNNPLTTHHPIRPKLSPSNNSTKCSPSRRMSTPPINSAKFPTCSTNTFYEEMLDPKSSSMSGIRPFRRNLFPSTPSRSQRRMSRRGPRKFEEMGCWIGNCVNYGLNIIIYITTVSFRHTSVDSKASGERRFSSLYNERRLLRRT